jgi:SAM-dependent methyltransferase
MTVAGRAARTYGRQVETGSLGVRAPGLARWLISRTQETRFGPFVTPQTFELSAADESLASGMREYSDGDGLFEHFPGLDPRAALAGRAVLDLGCGYGGRTVWYAERYAPQRIIGIEILPAMVERCRAFAERRAQAGVSFEVGFAERLEFADDSFDSVLSYDVLEHVQDPARALEEIARVLRPGGEGLFVFPTYLGARASHLDYVTRLPLLHRVFDPDSTIRAVNELLAAHPGRYGVPAQPPAAVTPVGRRALPTLNGMSRREAEAFIERAGLEVAWSRTAPFITENAPLPLAGALTRGMERLARAGHLPDVLIGHLAFRLHAPGSR